MARRFLFDLPGVLRTAGCDVYMMPGAESRSTWTSGFEPLGLIWHHTATSRAWQDGHVAALLRDGRRDLGGPLSQTGLERDGTWVIVALGRANHDGYGRFGNDAIGVEIYNSGLGEHYPPAQIESLERGSAAIVDHYGIPITNLLAHRESASHKIDPTGIDMPPARARVAALAARARTLEMITMALVTTIDVLSLVELQYREKKQTMDPRGATGWVLHIGQAENHPDLVRRLNHLRAGLGLVRI